MACFVEDCRAEFQKRSRRIYLTSSNRDWNVDFYEDPLEYENWIVEEYSFGNCRADNVKFKGI